MMKAVYLNRKAGPEALIVGEIPRPEPGEGEVVVRVHAAAITPTELEWYPTFNQKSGQPRPFPIVLSHEFSGVIDAVGADVRGLQPGTEVYGLNDWFANGALAEYCIAPASALAAKSQSIDHVHAAAAPISALTAWQGLFDRAKLSRGQRVLIHGAAGGVGIFAVQLAARCGAHVIATASAHNLEFVRSLGVNEVLDYRATRFETAVARVDVVFDSIGGETLERSWSVLKPGGTLVTIAAQSEGIKEQRVRDAFLLVEARGDELSALAKQIDAQELRVTIAREFPLAEARAAFEFARQGGMRGKVVLRVR